MLHRTRLLAVLLLLPAVFVSGCFAIDTPITLDKESVLPNPIETQSQVAEVENTDSKGSPTNLSRPPASSAEKGNPAGEILNIVKEFGTRLQLVSLLAPQDALKESLANQYGDLVTPELIEKWLANPMTAPGRLTSSPWPDRIEVNSITKLSDESYRVEGEIVEITSAELGSSNAASRQPVVLTLTKFQDQWLISSVTMDNSAATDAADTDAKKIVYQNDTYGFSFLLPVSWSGYKIVEEQWEGHYIEDPSRLEAGPKLLIRHPLWTENEPRQDIPIMVHTKDQWEAIESEELAVSAAPIGPRKIGENSQYVFAIPARYNFGFLTGFEEVEEILNSDPLISID